MEETTSRPDAPAERPDSAERPGLAERPGAASPQGEPLISVRGVNKFFGDFQALKDIDLDIHRGEVVALIGASGSGKSTFSRMLMARDPRGWTYISQDDTGSRSACETAIGNVRGGRVLLDLCNVSRAGRKEWLALAGHWATAPVCVWFDYPRALCVSRAQNRAGHPTLPPGNRVRNAVEQMHGAFARPGLAEGFKAVFAVRSFAAAEELVARLSPPVGLFKFPRTAHLLDLGSATTDDIVASIPAIGSSDAWADVRVVITEKVDGANMGFSLSADRTQILVQNRSHYVNPASHEQFRKLGLWVNRSVHICIAYLRARYLLK